MIDFNHRSCCVLLYLKLSKRWISCKCHWRGYRNEEERMIMCVLRCRGGSGVTQLSAVVTLWVCRLALACSLLNMQKPPAGGEDLPVASTVALEREAGGAVRTSQSELLPSLLQPCYGVPLSWDFSCSEAPLSCLPQLWEPLSPFAEVYPFSVSSVEWWVDFSNSDFPSVLWPAPSVPSFPVLLWLIQTGCLLEQSCTTVLGLVVVCSFPLRHKVSPFSPLCHSVLLTHHPVDRHPGAVHTNTLLGVLSPMEAVNMTWEKSPKAGGSAQPKEVCHWAYSGLEQCPNQTSWFPSRNVMHSFWKAHALQMKPHGELCRGATPLGLHITSHPRFSKSQWEVIALAAGRNFGGKVLCIWLVETRNQHHRNKNTRK